MTDKKAVHSPYEAAKREWNERYGDHIKSAYHWRLATFAVSLLALLAIAGLIFVSTKSRFVPYVVEVDKEGKVLRSGIPESSTISQRLVRSEIAEWISDHRSVTSDRVVQKKYINNVYALLAKGMPATKTVNAFYLDGNSPFDRMAKETVSVEIETLLAESNTTWIAEWTEHTTSSAGDRSQTKWKGIVVVAMAEPTIDSNPLGVFIQQFNFQKRLL